MTVSDNPDIGTIVAFYAYKGGTGRSMALANMACLLAKRLPPESKVLVMAETAGTTGN